MFGGVLSQHMTTLSDYLQTRKLKQSTETVTAAFHQNIPEEKRKLAIYNKNSLPTCLEVHLDKS